MAEEKKTYTLDTNSIKSVNYVKLEKGILL